MWAFHSIRLKMYNIRTQNIIGTQKSVYRDSPIGKLEESSLVRTMLSPHQQGFNSNSKTSLSVTINNLSTPALKQSVVARMPTLSHSTTAGTPFTGVVGINNVESDVFIKASGFNSSFEYVNWHTQNFFVKFSSFGFELGERLDSNIRIEFQSKVGDISNNLTDSVFDKVLFIPLKFHKRLFSSMASFIGKALKPLSSVHNLLSPKPHIFSKICLFQDFSHRGKNTDSETFAVHINPKHILLRGYISIFGEESNDLSVGCESIGFTYPSVVDKRRVPLKVSVLPDGDGNPVPGIYTQFNKELGFCSEGFAVSRDIKFNCDGVERLPFALNNIPFNITYNLTIEGGDPLAS